MKTKTFDIGEKSVQFTPKMTPHSSIKTVTPVQKLTPTVIIIDVQDDEEVVRVTEDDEVSWTEDEIGNLFQGTSSEEELGNEWLWTNLQAFQEEPSLQELVYIMQIQIHD